MGGQAIVGVAEVPQIVGHDEHPGHVRPEHVVLLLGGVDAEPAGHAEDIEDAGQAVEHVVPATVEGHAFSGDPGGAPAADGGFEVRDHGDEDVDGHDHEREALEPVGFADRAPLVFEGHKADAADGGRVELGVVEPAGHVHVGRVVECPVGAHCGGGVDGDEVDGQHSRDDEEGDDAAGFGATSQFIGANKAAEDEYPANPLVDGVVAVDLKQHERSFLICGAPRDSPSDSERRRRLLTQHQFLSRHSVSLC